MQYGYAQGASEARVTFPRAFSQLFSINAQRVPHPYSSGFRMIDWSNSDPSNEEIFNVNNSGFSFKGSYLQSNGGILYTAWGKI